MARIAGINVPEDKRIEIALTSIYGIGRNLSNRILRESGIDPNERIKNMDTAKFNELRQKIENLPVEGELKMVISQNIKRLKEIESYRGIRHKKNLPVRGQRTKTNARFRRGRKVTVGSGRKKTAEKT